MGTEPNDGHFAYFAALGKVRPLSVGFSVKEISNFVLTRTYFWCCKWQRPATISTLHLKLQL